MPFGSLGFIENLTVALPSAPVVPLSVLREPFGAVTTTDTATPEAAAVPAFTFVWMLAERLLPLLLSRRAVALTVRLETVEPPETLAVPDADPALPLLASVAVTLNGYDPVVPAGATSVKVVDALAPGASVADVPGENDPLHPLGTEAATLKADAAQAELLLLVTDTVYFNVPAAASDTMGDCVLHGVLAMFTRIIAPSTLVDSV